jgi:hypothetical protein
MLWFQTFRDGPEYEARIHKGVFTPPQLSLKAVRDAVPKHLFDRSTSKSLYYVFRQLAMAWALYGLATRIDHLAPVMAVHGFTYVLQGLVEWTLWASYWVWQSLVFAGMWCLGV